LAVSQAHYRQSKSRGWMRRPGSLCRGGSEACTLFLRDAGIDLDEWPEARGIAWLHSIGIAVFIRLGSAACRTSFIGLCSSIFLPIFFETSTQSQIYCHPIYFFQIFHAHGDFACTYSVASKVAVTGHCSIGSDF